LENKKIKLQESQGAEIKMLWQKLEEHKKIQAKSGDFEHELEQAKILNL